MTAKPSRCLSSSGRNESVVASDVLFFSPLLGGSIFANPEDDDFIASPGSVGSGVEGKVAVVELDHLLRDAFAPTSAASLSERNVANRITVLVFHAANPTFVFCSVFGFAANSHWGNS
jgi:hypothetical protein